MKQVKSRIIHKASELFAQQGITAVGNDDVAKACGISQDTVSLLFDSRETLLFEIVACQIRKTQQYLSIYTSISSNAITEIQNFFGCIEKMLDVFTPAFMHGLKQILPKAYNHIHFIANNLFIPFIYQNICRGTTEGIYREEIEKETITIFYCQEISRVMEDSCGSPEPAAIQLYHINNNFLATIVSESGGKLLKHS